MLGTALVTMSLGLSGKAQPLSPAELEMRVSRHRFLASNLARQGFRVNEFQERRASYLARKPQYQVIDKIQTKEKVVILTFDDGPYPGHTESILDILQANKIQATFFLIGNRVDDYPMLARRIVEEGHEVANHTYYHPNLTWLSKEEAKAEILAANWSIERQTGAKVTMGRPPGGQTNSTVQAAFNEGGLISVLWTISPGDLNGANRQQIISDFSKKLTPGAIVLLHDYPDATRLALPEIIKIGKSRGYRFVTLGDVLPAAQSLVP